MGKRGGLGWGVGRWIEGGGRYVGGTYVEEKGFGSGDLVAHDFCLCGNVWIEW